MNEALLLLLHFFAGSVNRRQLEVIEYLKEDNRVLREQLGGRRLRLTDAQRRRLAIRGKAIGRKGLEEVACIVTPPHQGLDNCLIDPDETAGQAVGSIVCRERLGGILRYYHREAA